MTGEERRRLRRKLRRQAAVLRMQKRMRRWRERLIGWALVGLCAALTILAVCAAAGAARSNEEPQTPATVAYLTEPEDGFNAGFRDSKQDDCEQGFKPACDWLADLKK